MSSSAQLRIPATATAAAVVANYKRDLDPASACQCLITFNTIKNVAASGDNVVLTMSAPMPAFEAAVIDSEREAETARAWGRQAALAVVKN